jgi:mitochondrial fission protein ELM1
MTTNGTAASAGTWILTDGSIGMENQGLAVAEAVGLPITLKRVKRTDPWRLLPMILQLPIPPRLLLGDRLAPPWPRLIISIGRHSVPLALAVRRLAEGATFALHIQNPKVPPARFDLVAAPAHDGMTTTGVLTTLGAPHRVTPAKLAAEAPHYAAAVEPLPKPRIAVLLGGDSKSFRFDTETGAEMGRKLAAMAETAQGSLLITPSRRTPPEAARALQEALGDTPKLFWTGSGTNPYFAFLALADVIIATSDSVNMVTEAAGTGKPVYVYPLPGRSARLAVFHDAMQRHGATRPFDGGLDSWSYAPVNDTEVIAGAVRRALGLEKG